MLEGIKQISPRIAPDWLGCSNLRRLTCFAVTAACRMHGRRLVVVLARKVHIYYLDTLESLLTLETPPNPRGLAVLSPNDKNNFLVIPSSATAGTHPSCSRLSCFSSSCGLGFML